MAITRQTAFREPRLAQEHEAAACDEGFAALINRQSRFVFRVAYSILRNAHDAEDVVQETFLKLYRSRAWESIENERAFLARVAWRIAVDQRKKVRHAPETGIPTIPAHPEQDIIAADWNATVTRLIDALPEELRQPLALSTVEELNSREIAKVMGIPEGTVRTRLMRARQILKQKLHALSAGPYEK